MASITLGAALLIGGAVLAAGTAAAIVPPLLADDPDVPSLDEEALREDTRLDEKDTQRRAGAIGRRETAITTGLFQQEDAPTTKPALLGGGQ